MPALDHRLETLRAVLAGGGGRLYAGVGDGGFALTASQHAALVLGPPRSGKTTGLVVPNVLAAPGAVVSTSTKPDVLAASLPVRSARGRCWLFDPTGTLSPPRGVTAIRWSPVCSAARWDDALVTAAALVGAARPDARRGEAAHWSERAEALLAPLLHAAALAGDDMRAVLGWVLRHDTTTAAELLARARSGSDSGIAADVLAGIASTDPREQSGIWSTAAGVLAAYRSSAALDRAARPNFDPTELASSSDTVYLCAPASRQALGAPITVAFLQAVRNGAYSVAATADQFPPRPLLLALDELANIAPLPDLPALVSEGGSQGVITLACLQDLSQARARWGPAADGFLSLFNTKVVLPGIADLATLELISRLAGEVDVPFRSVSQASGRWARHPGRTESWAAQRHRRLPVDAVSQLPAGSALLLAGARPPSRVRLAPWWSLAPFAPPPPRLDARETAATARGRCAVSPCQLGH